MKLMYEFLPELFKRLVTCDEIVTKTGSWISSKGISTQTWHSPEQLLLKTVRQLSWSSALNLKHLLGFS